MKENPLVVSNDVQQRQQQHLCNDVIKEDEDESDVKSDDDGGRLRIDEDSVTAVDHVPPPPTVLHDDSTATPINEKRPKKSSPAKRTKAADKRKSTPAQDDLRNIDEPPEEPWDPTAYGDICSEEIVDGFSVLSFETYKDLEAFTRRQNAEKARRLAALNRDLVPDSETPCSKSNGKKYKKKKDKSSKAVMKQENSESLKRRLDEDSTGEAINQSVKVSRTDDSTSNHVANDKSSATVIRQTEVGKDGVDINLLLTAASSARNDIVSTPSRHGALVARHQPLMSPASALPNQNPFQSLMQGGSSLFPIVGGPQTNLLGNPQGIPPHLMGLSAALQQSQLAAAAAACLPSTSHAAGSTSNVGPSLTSLFPYPGLLTAAYGGVPNAGLFPGVPSVSGGMPTSQQGATLNTATANTLPPVAARSRNSAVGGRSSPSQAPSNASTKVQGRWCSMHVKIAWKISNKGYPGSANPDLPTPTAAGVPSASGGDHLSSTPRIRPPSSADAFAAKTAVASSGLSSSRHDTPSRLQNNVCATPGGNEEEMSRPSSSVANGLPIHRDLPTGVPSSTTLDLSQAAPFNSVITASNNPLSNSAIGLPKQQLGASPLMKSPYGGIPSSSGVSSSAANSLPNALAAGGLLGVAAGTSRMSTTAAAPPPPSLPISMPSADMTLHQQQQMMQLTNLLRNQTDLPISYAAVMNGAASSSAAAVSGGRLPPPGFPFGGVFGGFPPISTASAIGAGRSAALPTRLLPNVLPTSGQMNPYGLNLEQQAELLRRQSTLLGMPDFGGAAAVAALEMERQRQLQQAAAFAAASAPPFNPFLPPGLAPSVQPTMGGVTDPSVFGSQNLMSLFQASGNPQLPVVSLSQAAGLANLFGGGGGLPPPAGIDMTKLQTPFSNTLEQLARQKQHFGPGGNDLLRR